MRWDAPLRRLGPLTVGRELASVTQEQTPITGDGNEGRFAVSLPIPAALVAPDPVTTLRELLRVVWPFRHADRVVVTAPEVCLLEALALEAPGLEVYVAVHPATPNTELKEIGANLPRDVRGAVLRVPELPPAVLSPIGTVLLTVGVDGGCGMTLVPLWAAEALMFWRAMFLGPSVLLDPAATTVLERPTNWVPILTAKWFSIIAGAELEGGVWCQRTR